MNTSKLTLSTWTRLMIIYELIFFLIIKEKVQELRHSVVTGSLTKSIEKRRVHKLLINLSTYLLVMLNILCLTSCEKDIQGVSQYTLMIQEPWIIQSVNGDIPQECAADDTYSFVDEGPLLIHYSGTPCYNNPDESQEGRYIYTPEQLILEYELGPFDISDH